MQDFKAFRRLNDADLKLIVETIIELEPVVDGKDRALIEAIINRYVIENKDQFVDKLNALSDLSKDRLGRHIRYPETGKGKGSHYISTTSSDRGARMREMFREKDFDLSVFGAVPVDTDDIVARVADDLNLIAESHTDQLDEMKVMSDKLDEMYNLLAALFNEMSDLREVLLSDTPVAAKPNPSKAVMALRQKVNSKKNTSQVEAIH